MKSMRYFISIFSILLKVSIITALLLSWVWGGLALFYALPDPEWLKAILPALFVISLPTTFALTRSFTKGCIISCCILIPLFIWWQTLQPTNNKNWAADVANISHGEISKEILTLHNVRNFRYGAEEIITDEQWETREYDLSKLSGLDLYLSYWASDHIAHTILSWTFQDRDPLAISIETRKDITQEFSATKGFFKQFELSYIAADERDLIRLRTNYRKERVYLYPLQVSVDTARALLIDYLTVMNHLVNKSEFYNALTKNCTTTIRLHTNAIAQGPIPPMNWRIIASGHLDEYLYEKELLESNLTFKELRLQSRVDKHMQPLGKIISLIILEKLSLNGHIKLESDSPKAQQLFMRRKV